MQYLYIIECQNFRKIGIANDVESRLSQLSTGNPFPLKVEIIYEFENAEPVERAIHQKYKHVRQRGEWFNLGYEDLQNIHKICYLLGGSAFEYRGEEATQEVIEEAEEIQETQDVLLSGIEWRLERRVVDRANPGWAIMKKGVPKFYLGYIKSSDIKDPTRPTIEEVENVIKKGHAL